MKHTRIAYLCRVYTSATCCAVTSCADEQLVVGNKQHVAGNKLLVARNMLLDALNKLLDARNKLLVARNMLLKATCCLKQRVARNVCRATCCAGVNAALGL